MNRSRVLGLFILVVISVFSLWYFFSNPLIKTADTILDKIPVIEGKADATCWTTVRMMENYYSSRRLDDLAGIFKIESLKALVFDLWLKASLNNSGRYLNEKKLAKSFPDDLNKKIAELNILKQAPDESSIRSMYLEQYDRVTEQLRYILSIIWSVSIKDPLYFHPKYKLKGLDESATNYLARAGTILTLDLLDEAVKASERKDHSDITPDDIKEAFKILAAKYELKGLPEINTEKMKVSKWTLSRLKKLSLKNIDNKITALKERNKEVWQHAQDPLDLINNISPVPFSRNGYVEMMSKAVMAVRPLALGLIVGRQDNGGDVRAWFEKLNMNNEKDKNKGPSVELKSAFEDLEQIFPVETLKNGDTKIVREINPTGVLKDIKDPKLRKILEGKGDEEIVLRHYMLDSLRDTTIHWQVMNSSFSDPDALVIDPFAMEFVSERISELLWYMIVEGSKASKVIEEPTVNAVSLEAAYGMRWLFTRNLPEVKHYKVDPEHKKQLLKPYSSPLYFDVSKVMKVVGGDAPSNNASYNGAGAAVADFDNDGLDDIFALGAGHGRIYRNLGGFKFEDVTDKVGIKDNNFRDGRMGLFGDINNDGLLDLVVISTHFPARVFKQKKDHTFEEFTKESGIVGNQFALSCMFFDVENDGDLDFFIGNVAEVGIYGPNLDGTNAFPNQLYLNDGEGHFTEVSKTFPQWDGDGNPTNKLLSNTHFTLSPGAADLNGDGFLDLVLVNDFGENQLFLNKEGKGFVDVSHKVGFTDRGSGMNTAFSDINKDGIWDIFITNIDMFNKNISFTLPKDDTLLSLSERILNTTTYLSGNKLYISNGILDYETKELELFDTHEQGWAWAAAFFDYDNDKDEDLFVSNGFKKDTFADKQKNQFYINNDGKFYLVEPGSAESIHENSRTVIPVDFNGDGKLDLFINNLDTAPRILKNLEKFGNRWLKVKLEGVTSNRFGVGAVVKIKHHNGDSQMRLMTAGIQYLSQVGFTLHFGVGKDTSIASIEVIWPGNKKQVVNGPIKTNQTLAIKEK